MGARLLFIHGARDCSSSTESGPLRRIKAMRTLQAIAALGQFGDQFPEQSPNKTAMKS
jgi:hypothetical protein